MNAPKISIIIPVYNVEKYLERCLDSCMKQTMKEIEVIVVNDASLDSSDLIMKKYEKLYPEKMKCIYLTQNIRQGGARNIGIKCARGEFVLFVDSDDWIHEDMCKSLYDKAKEENADIVYCDVLREKKDGYIINNRFPKEMIGVVNEESIPLLIKQLYVGPVAHIIKKDIILDNELFFPERVIYEDMAITRMWDIHACKIAKVEKPYYVYCLNMDSVGQVKRKTYIDDGFRCINTLFEKLKSDSKTEKFQKEREIICLHYAVEIAEKLMRELGKKFASEIQRDFSTCVQGIVDSDTEQIEWTYWFDKAKIEWIQLGIDYTKVEDYSRKKVEVYENYYEQLEKQINAVVQWFAHKGKRKCAIWGKTPYAYGLAKVFENFVVIDCLEEAQTEEVQCLFVLRSLHCQNVKQILRGGVIEAYNLQGYLLGDREIEKYII